MAVQVVTVDSEAQGVRLAPDALRRRDDGLFDFGGTGQPGPVGPQGDPGQRGPAGPATAPTVVMVSPLPPGVYTVVQTPMDAPTSPATASKPTPAPVALPTTDTTQGAMPGGLATGQAKAAWYTHNVALAKAQAVERHAALLAGMVDPVLTWIGNTLYRNGVPVGG